MNRYVLCAGLTIIVGTASDALAFRCDGRLVSEGDPAFRVRALCGAPTDVAERVRHRSHIDDEGYERTVTDVVEEWTYNRGRQRFVTTVVFVRGKVARIRSGGYGVESIGDDRHLCERRLFTTGTPAAEVRVKCGLPATTDRWFETRELSQPCPNGGPARVVRRTVRHDRWVYHRDERNWVELTFEDGRLVRRHEPHRRRARRTHIRRARW